MIIPMKYKYNNVLLGDLTNGMFISSGGMTFYKNTLLNVGVFELQPYSGNAKIEITDQQFNDLTRDYFRTLKRVNDGIA